MTMLNGTLTRAWRAKGGIPKTGNRAATGSPPMPYCGAAVRGFWSRRGIDCVIDGRAVKVCVLLG